MPGFLATQLGICIEYQVDSQYYGCIMGGGGQLIGMQALAMLAVGIWGIGISFGCWVLVKHVVRLRVREKMEMTGIDFRSRPEDRDAPRDDRDALRVGQEPDRGSTRRQSAPEII